MFPSRCATELDRRKCGKPIFTEAEMSKWILTTEAEMRDIQHMLSSP